MAGPRILVVGYNAWDVTVPVDGLPDPDAKCEVPPISMAGGGPAATAAVALARLGASVELVTPLTEDLPGRWQAASLAEAEVAVGHCPRRPGSASPMAVILADPGTQHRTILWSRGDVPQLRPDEVPVELLDGVDLFYCDGHEIPACLPLAAEARRRGLPVVLDAGSVRSGSDRFVPLCTDVISSRFFAPDLTGREDPAAALAALRAMGPPRVGMTFGSGGVLALDGGRPIARPAFDVPVLDTTGAGDAFHAGYAFALAEGLPFAECLDFGSAVAALKCRDWGGRRGLPTLPEVRSLLVGGARRTLDPLLLPYGC